MVFLSNSEYKKENTAAEMNINENDKAEENIAEPQIRNNSSQNDFEYDEDFNETLPLMKPRVSTQLQYAH